MKWFLWFSLIISTVADGQPIDDQQSLQIRLTDSIACTSVKDQSQSPTCWAFGSNSLFESDLIKQYGLELDLSEMFIARYAYIDKAKQYLATKGKTYFAGGGQFRDVLRIVGKYGMMPEEAYRGRPDGSRSHNHAKLDTAMKKYINGLLTQGKTALDERELKQVNDTLDRYLGHVPEMFWYNGKQYSPKTFASEVVKFGDDYIDLMSFADLPVNKKCLLNDKFNWAADSLYNISLNDFMMVVDTALGKGWSVGWEGDVTENGFNAFSGYVTLPDSSYQYDAKRLQDFKKETTERDHMLHLTGIGRDENNRKWYYLKNSWGAWLSQYKGHLYMNENYFRLKTVILMVNKQALPQQLKAKLGLE